MNACAFFLLMLAAFLAGVAVGAFALASLLDERDRRRKRNEETPEQDKFYIDTGKQPKLSVEAIRPALPEQKGSENDG